MGKHKSSLQSHHLYLGMGGMFAVAALVLALTFGLSSAQTVCTPPAVPDNIGGCFTPPAAVVQPPSAMVTCPNGEQRMTMLECPVNPVPNLVQDPAAQCTSSGGIWDGPSATPPCRFPGAAGGTICTGSQLYCPAVGTSPAGCYNSPCPTIGGAGATCPGSPQSCANNTYQYCQNGAWVCPTNDMSNGSAECARVGGTWQAGATPPCRMPGAGTACPAATPFTCVSAPGGCALNTDDCAAKTNAATNNQNMRTCNAGETPTTANPCRPSADQPGAVQTCPTDRPISCPAAAALGGCTVTALECQNASGGQAGACSSGQWWDQSTQTCKGSEMNSMSVCGPNVFPTPQNPCRMEGPGTGLHDREFTPPFFNKGQQKPPFFNEDEGREGGPREFMNPCEFNPNDIVCQSGFDFGKFEADFKFNESDFDLSRFKPRSSKSLEREVKSEVQMTKTDLDQVKKQLKEIARESGNFACPASAEVEVIALEMENFVSDAEAYLSAKQEEEVSASMQAKLEHVRDLRGQLFGGPPNPETGMPAPGKIQGLNVCREIAGIMFGACEASKNLAREVEQMKKGKAPESVLAAFENVLPKLAARCSNPLGVLQEQGVSIDELSKPWYPDPEVCSFGGGFGRGFPGHGGQMDFENFGGDFSPEMMELIKEKMKESRGSFEGGFGGDFSPGPGFRGSPFGVSVLVAPSHSSFIDDEDDDEDDLEGEEGFGPPEISDECKSPVHRYLGFDDIMREVEKVSREAEGHFSSMNACDMFEMGRKFVDAEGVTGGSQGRFGPPPEMKKLLSFGLDACEAGDIELVEKIKAKMLHFGRRGGRGLGDIADMKGLASKKLKEKVQLLLTDEEGEDEDLIAALEKKVADLQSKLTEVQQTVLALNEKLAEATAKLASVVELSRESTQAIGNITQLPEEAQQSVAGTLADLASSVDAVKKVLPLEGDKLIDSTMNVLIQSPPSEQAVGSMQEGFTAILLYAQSGANKDEVLKKVKDEVANITALNSADVSNKISRGIVATADTSNLGEWYAVPVLNAKNQGFVAKELTQFKPAEVETKCAALTRVARILEKGGDLEIDLDNKAPVAGAPEWCRPFVHAMQAEGVEFAKELSDPNAPADRLDIARLLHQAVGDKLPDPDDAAKYLTADVKGLSAEDQAAIAEIRYNGIMDATDGKNFNPFADFNRAQNALVTIKSWEAIQSESTEDLESSADEDLDLDFGEDEEGE